MFITRKSRTEKYKTVQASKAETALTEPETCQPGLNPHIVDHSNCHLGFTRNVVLLFCIFILNASAIDNLKVP